VNQDKAFLLGLLDAFIHDYEAWVKEHGLDSGLFWQYGTRDGMEESISGARREKNSRPPLNSYMYANAVAISRVAQIAGKEKLAAEYSHRAGKLKSLVNELTWDEEADFFKVRYPDGRLADVREELGFIPWYFNLPDRGREKAWRQLIDPKGFKAPWTSQRPSAGILISEVTAFGPASGTGRSGRTRQARHSQPWRMSCEIMTSSSLVVKTTSMLS
jgi:hypothetical protein